MALIHVGMLREVESQVGTQAINTHSRLNGEEKRPRGDGQTGRGLCELEGKMPHVMQKTYWGNSQHALPCRRWTRDQCFGAAVNCPVVPLWPIYASSAHLHHLLLPPHTNLLKSLPYLKTKQQQ